MKNYILLFIYVIASSFGMVLIKSGGKNSALLINLLRFEISLDWKFIVGIALYVISFILWILIIQLFPLTYISPIAYGLTFISLTILSIITLNQSVPLLQMVGAGLIILGILISSITLK